MRGAKARVFHLGIPATKYCAPTALEILVGLLLVLVSLLPTCCAHQEVLLRHVAVLADSPRARHRSETKKTMASTDEKKGYGIMSNT